MDVVVITFDGQIDDFPVLVQTLDGLIENGERRIVIDLHTLPFINSAALSYLVASYKKLDDDDGELALCRIQPAIQNILEMTKLDTVFPAFQTVDEAVDHLGGPAADPARKPAVRHHGWRS